MEQPYRVGTDVTVLPSSLAVPGVGCLPVNAFVIHAAEPVLVDTGLAVDADGFVDALRSVIDPAELRWVWLTHDDTDHAGNLGTVLELAPHARLATHAFGALRLNAFGPLPLDRVHAVRAGDRLDVGDRTLVAVRPPTFDNPMSLGIYDERTAGLFSVDAFGAILPEATDDLAEVPEDALVGGMVAWTTFDSPWAHQSDRARFAESLDQVRRLAPDTVLAAHLPPASGRLEAFLDVLASVPDAPPFEPPDATTFSAIAAQLGGG